MKSAVRSEIERVVLVRAREGGVEGIWERPLVGFASASDPLFATLRTVVSATHAMPTDLLGEAATAVAFFLPFTKAVAASNREGDRASREWGLAYIETNQLIRDISLHMKAFLEGKGFPTHIIPATHNFDEEKLISDWSHRHVAFIAGLGRFGLNNMLITESGCCGRVGSFVTAAPIEPDPRPTEEACLFRRIGTCRRCVERCVGDALRVDGFDRHRCYEVLLMNEARLNLHGEADVCGKCVVAVPCSHAKPGGIKRGARDDESSLERGAISRPPALS